MKFYFTSDGNKLFYFENVYYKIFLWKKCAYLSFLFKCRQNKFRLVELKAEFWIKLVALL